MERRKTSLLPNKEAITRRRVLAGMGKHELAAAAGIAYNSLVRAERGEGVRERAAVGICRVLGAELEELFTVRS